MSLPTFKEIVDPEDPEKKRKKKVTDKQMVISAPITEDVTNGVFSFTPLIQAVGTLAKDAKTITEVSGSIDLKAGMVILDARFPAATSIVSVTPTKGAAGFFTVEMSAPATAAAANAVLRFRPSASTTGNSRGAAPSR